MSPFTNLTFAQAATAPINQTDAAPAAQSAPVGNTLPGAAPAPAPAANAPTPVSTGNALPGSTPAPVEGTAPTATATTVVPASKPAEQKPQQGLFGEGMSGFIYIGLFVLAIWFLVLRPQRKQEKELRKRQSELKAGDQVITTAGIHGKVVSIDASNILLQIADGVRVRFERAAIITVVKESKDEKAAKS